MTKASLFLHELSEKIFLAADISQIFLFLSPESRKSLFKVQSKNEFSQNDYYTQLKKEKPKLPGFFTYDFLDVGDRQDVLNAFFKLLDLHNEDPTKSYLNPIKLFAILDLDIQIADINNYRFNNTEDIFYALYNKAKIVLAVHSSSPFYATPNIDTHRRRTRVRVLCT